MPELLEPYLGLVLHDPSVTRELKKGGITVITDFINYFSNFSFDLTCAYGVRKLTKKRFYVFKKPFITFSLLFSQLATLLINNKGPSGVANNL